MKNKYHRSPEHFKFRRASLEQSRRLATFHLAWLSEDDETFMFPDLNMPEGIEAFINFLVNDFGLIRCERPSQIPLSAERDGEYYIGKECFWCVSGIWLNAKSENYVPEGWLSLIEPSEVELKQLLAVRYCYLTPTAQRLRDHWPQEIYNRRRRLREDANSLRHSRAPIISEPLSTAT
jgi:hypothetical protein